MLGIDFVYSVSLQESYLNALYNALYQHTNEQGVKRTRYKMDRPKLTPESFLMPSWTEAMKYARFPSRFRSKRPTYAENKRVHKTERWENGPLPRLAKIFTVHRVGNSKWKMDKVEKNHPCIHDEFAGISHSSDLIKVCLMSTHSGLPKHEQQRPCTSGMGKPCHARTGLQVCVLDRPTKTSFVWLYRTPILYTWIHDRVPLVVKKGLIIL